MTTDIVCTEAAATPETDLARAVPLMAGRGMDCAELLTDLGAVEPHDSGGPEPIPSTWSTDPGQYPLDLGEET